MARTALIAGATGFIGGRLVRALSHADWDVRCLVRDPGSSSARALAAEGFALHRGDVLDRRTLRGAGAGAEVAYYLVHSMGRGSRGHFAERELRAARAFAEMARGEGVGRVIYLGGLGERLASDHLRSRHETAQMLGEHGPPLTYLRAGMVVGSGSESYRTLRYLVQRLPAMIAPAWLKNPTQPIAIDDTIAYLADAASLPPGEGYEIQIGGPDVLSYGEMLDRMAAGARARAAPPGPGAVHHAVAVLAVDRARHAGRCGYRPPADRRALGADRRHRPVRHGAVRHPADRLR